MRAEPHGPARQRGAAAQALLVEDDDGLALQLDPAAVHEVGQRLVHRLAGGADQLGQLLLREVVLDAQALAGRGCRTGRPSAAAPWPPGRGRR